MAKPKMIMSLSFKAKEESMWNHIQNQFDAAYYIKMLIFNDMNGIQKEVVKNEIKKEVIVQVENIQKGYAEIDF